MNIPIATIAAAALSVPVAAAPVDRKGQTDIVAAVICAEAKGEYWAGMCAVAQVIRNRGLIAFDVVTKPKQFSCLNHTTPAALVQKEKQAIGWSDAHCLARWLCGQSPKPSVFIHSVGDATHYHRKCYPVDLPYWAVGEHPVAFVGHHIFYMIK